MNRTDLSLRARSLVRDLSNSFFREIDITNYLNEGIERVAQVIPQLALMSPLTSPLQEVDYLPNQWQHILALYCSARLCTQDERHYQAGVFMNEFEMKLDSFKSALDNGEVTIYAPDGSVVGVPIHNEYVNNRYFTKRNGVMPRDNKEFMWGD